MFLPSLHRRALLAATLALVISGCGGESDSTAPSPNSTAPADTGTTATPNTPSEPDPVPPAPTSRDVIFVGNNWEGMIDVVDRDTHERLGRINGIPDKQAREAAIVLNPVDLVFFIAIQQFIGEGHHQYVDDMYSSNDGRLLIVSRPSYADVVALDIASGEIEWRFEVDGNRSDHMAISPDGKHVAVSASTGNVVHVLDVQTGEEVGRFPSGNSPHENVYSEDGKRIYHASIGHVFTPLDRDPLKKLKGERVFQVVDAETFEILRKLDIKTKLEEAGYADLSPAVRPMAHTHDERYFYFQLSFLHGFIEYDMEEDRITRVASLPNLIPDTPQEVYVNDSAHHGIALSADNTTLCVAGTMSDYVALVNRETFEYSLKTGIGEKPYWVTTSEDGEHCYVSWSGTDQMSIFHYASGQEVARVDVGDHPQRIREGRVPIAWVEAQGSLFLP
ncbi:serine/threonine protein kinase [Alcanivorax sp. MD8A]|uniref:YncE family protein n=1 Tax=Alcanivorax sp. MD8A TaxID=1177157 RepID=UPI000C9C25B7|nr:serine/threonine protein kinase [Alcanivorax sp. MD8A]PNE04282.1 serine/threonine protein kinase [Alcanivorax sp. MD8A]